MSTTEFSFRTSHPPPVPIHRFSVDEYHRLGELGVLSPEDRVELLEGWIVEKMNQRPAHGFVVSVLDAWLQSGIPNGWTVRCQLPITLENSEPEPDLAVIRGSHKDYRHRHPGGEDCRLLIEVADTSLSKDFAKAAIYASAGVQEYWLVDLANNCLHRMEHPDQQGVFLQTTTLTATESIEADMGETKLSLPLTSLFDHD